jgi:lipid A 4'-phosphatase
MTTPHMNRTGLLIAFTVAVPVAIVFGIYGDLDVKLSRLFFDPDTHMFTINAQPWVSRSRDASRLLVALLAAPAFLAICGKLILPRRRMLISGRASLFLALTLTLGPGILANTVLKDHWGRARPIDITEFGGANQFTSWWDPRGHCPNNCSFVAGEPAGAFWTLAPAALAPPEWRLIAFTAALAIGSANGLLRIAAGGHYFTDVVFAGVIMYLVVWVAHRVIYWRATSGMGKDEVEGALERIATVTRKNTDFQSLRALQVHHRVSHVVENKPCADQPGARFCFIGRYLRHSRGRFF